MFNALLINILVKGEGNYERSNPQVFAEARWAEETLFSKLDEILAEHRDKYEGVIFVLQIERGLFSYLPENVLRYIAKGMDKPYSEVAGMMGFYSFFSPQPTDEIA